MLVASALYLSLFNASGGFYDIVRPDPLAIAFLAWAVVIGLERVRGAAVASGLLRACAFAGKHNLAVVGLPLLAHQWLLVSREAGIRFAAASIGPALLFTGWMQWVTGGNFLRFIVGVPGSHPMSGLRGFPGAEMELVLWLFPGLACAAIYLFWRAIPRVDPAALSLPLVLAGVLGAWAPGLGRAPGLEFPEDAWVRHGGFVALGLIAGSLIAVAVDSAGRKETDGRWVVGALLAGVAMVISALMRAHHGGFINVLMPLHWASCFGLAVLAGRARNLWGLPATAATAGIAVVALFWAGSRMELERLVPTPEDEAAGAVLLDELRKCPEGPIHSPYAAWIPVKIGREPSAHLIGIWDINHPRGPFRDAIPTFVNAAKAGYWPCVVEGGGEPLHHGIDEYYELERTLPIRGKDLSPKTGWRARPHAIFVRKK